MAEVYKAYQGSLDRYVAIKLLHPFLADDPEFKDRFEREARNVARLRHPNIVQVYDFEYDSESESYYMVMELIDGQTLKDRLTELGTQRMQHHEALRIVYEATQALAYAHARSMIHRDVKPANLMIDSDGRVVLTDFGIAKIVTGVQFTASGGMVGTPAFMAPEQGLGEAGDERSDLYSMGVILFQLMTGQLPYDAATPLATILKHLNEPMPDIKAIAPDVPDAIAAIITKTMEKDPEDRYQTAQEMLTAVSDAMGLPAPTPVSITDTTPLPSVKVGEGRSGGKNDHPTETGKPEGERPTLATSTVVSRPRQRTALAGVSIIGLLVLVGLFASLVNGGIVKVSFLSSPTPSPTVTLTPTITPSLTLTDTLTPTPTLTLSYTPTYTPTYTLTPTLTPSDTPTWTPSITPSFTPSNTPTDTWTPSPTETPTPNFTETLAAGTATKSAQLLASVPFPTAGTPPTQTPNYTQTYIVCTFSYLRVNFGNPSDDPIPIYKSKGVLNNFTRTISLKNTSTCTWPVGTYLLYVSGTDFGATKLLKMTNTDPVDPGDVADFKFDGVPPADKNGIYRGGTYTGQWELHLASNELVVKPLLDIAFFVYNN
jgi:serine/threonine protein kinase